MYGGYGKVKTMRGQIHNYLGITFDLSDKEKEKIHIIEYMDEMVNKSPIKSNPNDTSPDPEAGYFFFG